MPRGEHFYRCLDCGIQDTCGDCIRIYCIKCAKKLKTCRKCGRVERQESFGFSSVCSVCWEDGNLAMLAERDAPTETEASGSSALLKQGVSAAEVLL